MSVVVSDTPPIHFLVECEAIEILPALFQEVLIRPTVHRELQHQSSSARAGLGGGASRLGEDSVTGGPG